MGSIIIIINVGHSTDSSRIRTTCIRLLTYSSTGISCITDIITYSNTISFACLGLATDCNRVISSCNSITADSNTN